AARRNPGGPAKAGAHELKMSAFPACAGMSGLTWRVLTRSAVRGACAGMRRRLRGDDDGVEQRNSNGLRTRRRCGIWVPAGFYSMQRMRVPAGIFFQQTIDGMTTESRS